MSVMINEQRIDVTNHAKKAEEENTHAVSDLEACYDRQLPELCGLVEEIFRCKQENVHTCV